MEDEYADGFDDHVEEEIASAEEEADTDEVEQSTTTKRQRVETPSQTSTSTNFTLINEPNHRIALNASADVPLEGLTLDEIVIDIQGEKPYKDLTNGAKLLVRLSTLQLDPTLAMQAVNIIYQMRTAGTQPTAFLRSVAMFQFPMLTAADLADYERFDKQFPDNFSSFVLTDPKLDRVLISRSNFVSIFGSLVKYVASAKQLDDSHDIEIGFKALKTIVLSSLMFDSQDFPRNRSIPLIETSRSELSKLFTGMQYVNDLPHLSMFHEFAGMFPHEVDKKTGVSHNVAFRSAPPFTYPETIMSSFMDRVPSQIRPSLPHLLVSRTLASSLSTYKLGHLFACAPGDTFLGQYFFAAKLYKALTFVDDRVTTSLVQAAANFRTIALRNLHLKDSSFKLSDGVLKDMKDELSEMIIVLNVIGTLKNRFGSIMLDFLKGSYYFLMSFENKWRPISEHIQRDENQKLIPTSVSKFLKVVTGTDNKIDQVQILARYSSLLSSVAKAQDTFTPLNDNFAFGKTYLMNLSQKLAIQKAIDRVYLSKADDGTQNCFPILFSYKSPFQSFLDFRDDIPHFTESVKPLGEPREGIFKFLLTKGKSEVESDLYSFDLPTIVAKLRAILGEPQTRRSNPVIIINLHKLTLRFVRTIFEVCSACKVIDYIIIGSLSDIVGGEEPLILTSEDKQGVFPSIMNCQVTGEFMKEHAPFFSFNLRHTAQIAPGDKKQGVIKGVNSTYSRLAWSSVFVFLGLVDSVGSHTKYHAKPRRVNSEMVFGYLKSVLGKPTDDDSGVSFSDAAALPFDFEETDDSLFNYEN